MIWTCVGIALGIGIRMSTGQVHGEHWYAEHKHLGSMNYPAEFENSCIHVQDDSIDRNKAYNNIVHTMAYDNASQDYHGLRHITYTVPRRNCGDPQPPQEIIFFLHGDGCFFAFPLDQYRDRSCMNHDLPYFDIGVAHNERGLARLWLDDDDIEDVDRAHETVNHELGHAFGLEDGGPENPLNPPDPNYMPTPCTGSVMHIYGCDHADWPTAEDRESVEGLVPSNNPGNPGGKAFSLPFG